MTIANLIRAELAELPAWVPSRPPDFVIVGVKKAGTGQLISTLKKHSKAVGWVRDLSNRASYWFGFNRVRTLMKHKKIEHLSGFSSEVDRRQNS